MTVSSRLVYEGDSGIGHVTIREGDYVRFNNPYSGYSGYLTEGRAFYYTAPYADIPFRMDDYDYTIEGDCHSRSASDLIQWVPSSGKKERKKTGFGKFISRLEEVESP